MLKEGQQKSQENKQESEAIQLLQQLRKEKSVLSIGTALFKQLPVTDFAQVFPQMTEGEHSQFWGNVFIRKRMQAYWEGSSKKYKQMVEELDPSVYFDYLLKYAGPNFVLRYLHHYGASEEPGYTEQSQIAKIASTSKGIIALLERGITSELSTNFSKDLDENEQGVIAKAFTEGVAKIFNEIKDPQRVDDVSEDESDYDVTLQKIATFLDVFGLADNSRVLEALQPVLAERAAMNLLQDDPEDDEIPALFSLSGFEDKTVFAKSVLEHTKPSLYFELEQRMLMYGYGEQDELIAPWAKVYKQLEGIQARASNKEYDPWVSSLDPLVAYALKHHLLNPAEEADGRLLLGFVKRYGMINAPQLLALYCALERERRGEQNPKIDRALESLGITRSHKDQKGQVHEKIAEKRREIQSDLLEDIVPDEVMQSRVGFELFSGLIGTSDWEKSDDKHVLLQTWEETAKKKPEWVNVPEAFEEVHFSVDQVRKRMKTQAYDEEYGRIIKDPQLSKTLSELDVLADLVLRRVETSLQQFLQEWERHLDEEGLLGKNDFFNDIWDLAFELEVEECLELLEDFDFHEEEETTKDTMLLKLSLFHIAKIMPQSMRSELNASLQTWGAWHNRVATWDKVITQYIKEHYLHPSQDPEHTGHKPFSDKLLHKLRGVWGLVEGQEEHPILKTKKDLDALERSLKVKTGKTLDVSLVPARGALRIFSGDIGNACYTSLHSQLAEGEYEGITAYVYVTGRGTPKEELQGSLLVVEAKEFKTNKDVIVIRANNPKQRLLNQVDEHVLLTKTMEAMKELGTRMKATDVLVPYDEATESSTNRVDVARWYHEQYTFTPIELLSTEETNFNEYEIWDPDDAHAVVSILKGQE